MSAPRAHITRVASVIHRLEFTGLDAIRATNIGHCEPPIGNLTGFRFLSLRRLLGIRRKERIQFKPVFRPHLNEIDAVSHLRVFGPHNSGR